MSTTEEQEYVLGTDRDELERLRFQHEVWLPQGYALWRRAGFREGDALLDLGCGPGVTSFELANVVGTSGRVIARDQSPRFMDFLEAERARRARPQVETSVGTVEELDLAPGSVDGAYARWLFCWLEDPAAALARVASALRPGGAIALQDYLDWAAVKLVPRSAAVDRAIDACMRSWEVPINVGERIPALAAECGLVLEHFEPITRAGMAGSFEWRWIGGFLHIYLPKLVERGIATQEDLEAFRADWRERTQRADAVACTPTMVDVVLRKP